MPGAVVAIGLNGPPVSVPGLRSHVSSWLWAPCIHSRMHAFALPADADWPRAKGMPNFDAIPAAAPAPSDIRTKSRREQLGQWAMRHPIKTNSEELNSIQKMSA